VGGILPGFAGFVGRQIGRLTEKLWEALIFLDFAPHARHSSGQRDGFRLIPTQAGILKSNKCCYLKQQVSGIFRIINRE